ncbi:MAG: hypothetical protein RLZZ628_3893, partial [Bacteroidota bacterium]
MIKRPHLTSFKNSSFRFGKLGYKRMYGFHGFHRLVRIFFI